MNNTISNQDARSTVLPGNYQINGSSYIVDFEVTDKKGRKLGTCIMTCEREYTQITPEMKAADPYMALWCVVPGRYFSFTPHATRDGGFFGASQGGNLFHTAAERDAAIAKYLKSAKARAIKNAGK